MFAPAYPQRYFAVEVAANEARLNEAKATITWNFTVNDAQ
jgi:hypothetical protein